MAKGWGSGTGADLNRVRDKGLGSERSKDFGTVVSATWGVSCKVAECSSAGAVGSLRQP